MKKNNTDQYIVVLVTAPSKEVADNISSMVLEKRLAACVNIVPSILSLFHWDNKINVTAELMLVLKSKMSLFQSLEEEIKANHSYKVPEIIALPIIAGSEDYLSWIDNETD